MATFESLDDSIQASIREKQRSKAARKLKLNEQAKGVGAPASVGHPPRDDLGLDQFPTSISQDDYFDACPAGLFSDPSLIASEVSVDTIFDLMAQGAEIGRFRDGTIATLKHFSYYQFAGTDTQVWDPTLYARLAHAGFFTITTKRPRPASKKSSTTPPPAASEPLAELQPFYSVVGWRQFESAKHVRRTLKRLRDQLPRTLDIPARSLKSQAEDAATAEAAEIKPSVLNMDQSKHSPPETLRYRLKIATDGGAAVWQAIDRYQKAQMRGNNWLTIRYLDLMRRASADPTMNFTVHAVELWESVSTADNTESTEKSPDASEASRTTANSATERLVAGEIGYSVGAVYTSLSGFSSRQVENSDQNSAADSCCSTASSSGKSSIGIEGCSGTNVGTIQLVLLGRWLQLRGYAFWSLGHCYSPSMEYKRQLGHRVVPREPFLALLAQHRGNFRQATPHPKEEESGASKDGSSEVPDKHGVMTSAAAARFNVLADGDTIDFDELIAVSLYTPV